MARIPPVTRDEMDAEQARVYDDVMATTGRVSGPSLGYVYSPGLWEATNKVSDHLADCALTQPQVRMVALMTARFWDAEFPWFAQVGLAKNAGLPDHIIHAINDRRRPDFDNDADAAVYDLAKETLEQKQASDAAFERAAGIIGYPAMVDVIGAIGHFCKVGLMAVFVGAEAPDDAPIPLKV